MTLVKFLLTNMRFSLMRTARRLTVSGVCLLGGGLPSEGGLPSDGGLPVPGHCGKADPREENDRQL